MNPETITSAQNPKIKHLLALQEKSRLRREEGLFVVEGCREMDHCLEAGFEPESVFFCPEILTKGHVFLEYLEQTPLKLYSVPGELYEKIAYRGSTEGIIGVMKEKKTGLDDLHLRRKPLIAVLEKVEKPGNLGAVLRSADAAGVDAVLICDPLTDIYNPNLIRASIGAVFTVPVVCCSSEDAIAWLKGKHIRILTAQLQDSSPYYKVDMNRGTAIVMGTESTGLTDIWRDAADAHMLIPMLGKLDSLNVSVSAAVLLYEAVRQRMEA